MRIEFRHGRTARVPHRSALLALAASLLLFTSCGDDTAGPDDDDEVVDDPPVTLAIEIGLEQARTGERVGISGVPANENVWAVVTAAGGATSIAFLERVGGRGGDRLIVPLHPNAPMQGGSVEIEVTNGSNVSSNRVPFTIDPLPSASGAFATLVDDLQLLLDEWLAQAGTTRGELTGTPVADLPIAHLQLLMVHNMLDRDENPNSMRAFADGDIPLFDGASIDRDLLDALVGASGTPAFVTRKLVFADTLSTPPPPGSESTRDRATEFRGGGCFEGPTFGIGPDDCDALSGAMTYQSALAVEAASAAQQVEDSVQGIFFTAMGFTPAAPYAAGVAATFWAAKTVESAATGLYPSQFVAEATDFDADPIQFPEDFIDDGLWNHFRVTAVSDGWRFDRVAFEAVMQVLGAAGGGPGDIVDALEGQASGAAIEEAVGAITDFITTESTNLAISELVGESGLALEYCPQTWPGINCTGAPYSIGSSSSARLEVDDASRTYKPTDLGSAQLRVETIAGAFGAAHTAEDKIITTDSIEVFIDPFEAQVGTDETVNFSVRVTNAIDPSVAWSWTGGGTLTPGDDTASLVTPSSPWNPPIEVKAVSLASTGLRKDGKPVRGDIAPVIYADSLVIVNVTPGYRCISNDETLDLTAEVTGLADATVTWSIEEGYGNVVSTGARTARYTPPPIGTTDDTILAQVVDHPESVDRAHVRVSACTCFYEVDIVGGSSWQEAGGDIAYYLLTDGKQTLAIQFIANFDDPSSHLFGASIAPTDETPAPEPGDTGDFRMNFSYSGGGQNWTSTQLEEDTAVFLSISEFTVSYMVGRMHGTAARRDENGDIVSTVLVNVDFRAGLFDGSWPCE